MTDIATEAFNILKTLNQIKKINLNLKLRSGIIDFQSEHERFLVEKYFKNPVIVRDYPKKIKLSI